MPAGARAATVEYWYGEGEFEYRWSSFRVFGEADADDLRITYMKGGALDVVDPSRPVAVRAASDSRPADLCRSVDEHHVRCQGVASSSGNDVDVEVQAGDGDDRVTLDGSGAVRFAAGGAGDDVLLGGAADDGLQGGPGDDVLEGGPGRNFLDVDGAVQVDLAAGRLTSTRGVMELVGFAEVEASGQDRCSSATTAATRCTSTRVGGPTAAAATTSSARPSRPPR
ncbi:MAG: hypothetical protein HZB46_18315 [Solirubrobacterales bacterium]|nr:hypothetical protein [Solirubrobacterales bacterium]